MHGLLFIKTKMGLQLLIQNILDESNGKPNNIWVGKYNELYNWSMKSRSQDNVIEMNSAYNEEISIVTKRFMRTLKKIFYKYTTLISKIGYIGNLDDIVNKYNNTYHTSIKMKLTDVYSGTCIKFGMENTAKDPKFRVGKNIY